MENAEKKVRENTVEGNRARYHPVRPWCGLPGNRRRHFHGAHRRRPSLAGVWKIAGECPSEYAANRARTVCTVRRRVGLQAYPFLILGSLLFAPGSYVTVRPDACLQLLCAEHRIDGLTV